MNTNEIVNVLSTECGLGISFAGVFPCDRLPLSIQNPGAVICNTDPHDKPGAHWVAMYVDGDVGEYFDSYGLPPINSNFVNFLK